MKDSVKFEGVQCACRYCDLRDTRGKFYVDFGYEDPCNGYDLCLHDHNGEHGDEYYIHLEYVVHAERWIEIVKYTAHHLDRLIVPFDDWVYETPDNRNELNEIERQFAEAFNLVVS